MGTLIFLCTWGLNGEIIVGWISRLLANKKEDKFVVDYFGCFCEKG